MLGQPGMNHWVRPTQGVDLVGFHCETSHRFFFKASSGWHLFVAALLLVVLPLFWGGGHLLVALGTGGQPGGCPGSGDKPAWGLGA